MSPAGPLILPHGGIQPRIAADVFLAPGCAVIGDVVIGPRASIWFGCVVRGDVHRIRIGAETNVQDGSIVHGTGGSHPVEIGERVTVGHGAILHGCTIGSDSLIGMGALVMDGAVVGAGSIVGARSLVPPGAAVPSGVLVLGAPAKVVRTLDEGETRGIADSAARYVELAAKYRRASTPGGTGTEPAP